nr:GntR family transcriptional regulator [uncultured Pedobacter sp.]
MRTGFLDSITIDLYSATPKYQQLSNSIVQAIEDGRLKVGDRLPSLNECYEKLELSKDSAEKCYKKLKQSGLIKSVPKKGYYITTTMKASYRILFLLNKLSEFKKLIYDSFVNSMKDQYSIEVGIYNSNIYSFKKLLRDTNDYSHIVVIPHFKDNEQSAFDAINAIPKRKLVILDRAIPLCCEANITVCQNFKEDIYRALLKLNPSLMKYEKMKILFTKENCFPFEILEGFKAFCQDFAYEYEVLFDLNLLQVNTSEVFICLTDTDMATLIESIEELGHIIGMEVGIISYNETPIKKFIRNGITTISTDFPQIGKEAAKLILNNVIKKVEIPFQVNLRGSL